MPLFGGGGKLDLSALFGGGKANPMAAMGGFDRNASMMGQSGFAPMNAKKPGLFGGGGFRDALGAFGDAFSEGEPLYMAQKQQQQNLMARQRQAELERAQGREDFLWKQENTRRDQNPHRWESNDGSLMEIDANGQARQVYKDPTPKMHFQPDGGGFGGGTWVTPGMPQQAQQPLYKIGDRLPPQGGPASTAPGNFPASRY